MSHRHVILQVIQRRLEVSRLEEQVERLKAERRNSRYVALQEKVAERGIYEHTRKHADEPGCVRTLETAPRRDSVQGLAWAADSVHLATVCDDTLYVWDTVKGEIKQQLGLPGGGVTRLSAVTFLSDQWLAHGATDGDYRISLVRVPCLCPKREREAAGVQPPVAIVHGAHTRQVTDIAPFCGSGMHNVRSTFTYHSVAPHVCRQLSCGCGMRCLNLCCGLRVLPAIRRR